MTIIVSAVNVLAYLFFSLVANVQMGWQMFRSPLGREEEER